MSLQELKKYTFRAKYASYNKEKKRKDLKNYLDERLSGHLPVTQRRKIVGYRLHIKWKHYGTMGDHNGRTFDPDISSNASSLQSRDELDD